MLFACVYLSIVSDINTCTGNKSGCVKHFTVQKKVHLQCYRFYTIHIQYMYSGITSGKVLKGGGGGRGGGGGGGGVWRQLNICH